MKKGGTHIADCRKVHYFQIGCKLKDLWLLELWNMWKTP